MLRPSSRPLAPAADVWGALLEIATAAGAGGDAAATLELARSLLPQRQRIAARRRGSFRVPAGNLVEILPAPRRGAPLLAPAAGELAGVDEHRLGLSVYRVLAAGSIDGRQMPEGAKVILSRRSAGRGELVAVADGRSLRLCIAGAAGRAGIPEEARVLGVVEGVVGADERRRSA